MDKAKEGYVYFVSAYHYVPCGYFKVGITRCKSYKDRISQIQSNSPFKVFVVCVVTDSDPETLEWMVLDQFKKYRIRGEWFAMTEMYEHSYDRSVMDASILFEKQVSEFMIEMCDGEIVYHCGGSHA